MNNIDMNSVQDFCNDFSDAYNDNYSEAVMNLRNYIQILILETQDKKFTSLNSRLKILEFIEEKFNNDINWFFNFIKKLNQIEYKANSNDKIEEVLRKELWYKWEWIFN